MYDAQRTADYLEIQDLNARYNYYADTGDGESYAELFVEDGEFEVHGYRTFRGRAELAACCVAGGYRVVHVTMNPLIDVDGDVATQRVRLLSCTRVEDGSVNEFANSGFYFDVLRRTPQGWRFVRRKAVSDLDPALLLAKNGTVTDLDAIPTG